jgi:hypothetical protein
MQRAAALLFLMVVTVCAYSQNVFTSDSAATQLAKEAAAALTGGAALRDVTLNATVTSFAGPDSETGTGILEAKGSGESRVEFALSGGTQIEVRNTSSSPPICTRQKDVGTSKRYPEHNCLTDAAWFFPALSSLNRTSTPAFYFEYIGQGEHNGVNADHLVVFQSPPQLTYLEGLSEMEFYLDPQSHLPLSVVFNTHPDADMNTNVRVEIKFDDYRAIGGIQVPFHIQRLVNGSVVLDLTITSAVFNTGLADGLFSLQ